MVRMRSRTPQVHTIYQLKPGQTLENTKVSERSLALVVPESVFQRFIGYGSENEKVALLAEREAKRLAALQQATFDMSKNWNDTAQNIQKRRREELLSRKTREEAQRIKIMKELAEQNAAKRAEVVRQAKELLLYRKPQCRAINRALQTAEIYRELEEQLKFQRSQQEIMKKLDEEYAQWVRKDVKKFNEEEQRRRAAVAKKIQTNKENLEKQIAQNKKELTRIQEAIKKAELEDTQNMSKEIEEMKRKELEETIKKKEELRKMFLGAIEDRKQYLSDLLKEEEFQDKNIKIYQEMKEEMIVEARNKKKSKMDSKALKAEHLAQKLAKIKEKQRRIIEQQNKLSEEVKKKLDEEQDLREAKKREEKERKKEFARQMLKDIEESREKRKKEEMDMKLWETMQRYKRVEFNKQWELKHREEERQNRLQYGKVLKKQMAYDEAMRRLAKMDADDSVITKEIINRTNEKVLAYAEKVLQESRGVRNTYPIEKAIEEFKREAGLIPYKNIQSDDPGKPPSRLCPRRKGSPKSHDDENVFQLG